MRGFAPVLAAALLVGVVITTVPAGMDLSRVFSHVCTLAQFNFFNF
jgi:hypothetical protein